MTTTSYQTKTSYQIGTRDTFARVVAHVGQLIEGAREGKRIRVISNYPGSQAPSWLVAASTARARWRS